MFAKKSVASVLKVFEKAISDLTEVEGNNRAEVQRQGEIIAEAQEKQIEADNEAARAALVVSNLKKLLDIA